MKDGVRAVKPGVGGGQPTQALGLSPQLKKLNAKDEVMPTSKTAKTASRNRIDDSIRRVF